MNTPLSWHARHYQPPMARWWWLERRSYTAFILREFSSVFVAWTVAYLLLLVRAAAGGGAEYQRFLDRAASPWLVALNGLALAFVLYHAVTFINLTPQAMPPARLRGHLIPGRLVTGAIYATWLVASAFLAWLVMG